MSTIAFTQLKQALTTAPVLTLPDFDKTFVLETDASGKGIGAVLMQDNHPIAYISKSLGPRQQALSIYERELLAIVYAVQKWSTYLAHKPFVIKTDQKSIKYILEQRLNTPFQQAWVAKLMGYEFEILYKEGKENKAADALSRIEGVELIALVLNSVDADLLQKIQSTHSDPHTSKIIQELEKDPASHQKFAWQDKVLRRKGKLVLGNSSEVKTFILHWLHDSSTGGHYGRDKTYARVKSLFYWKGMSKYPTVCQTLYCMSEKQT